MATVGGAMAFTFFKAKGYEVGNSRVEADKLDLALEILAKAEAMGKTFLLPADTRKTDKFEEGALTRCTALFEQGGGVPTGWMGIDIGDRAIEEFRDIILNAKTILWNGPVGVFEIESFAKGTRAVATAYLEYLYTDEGQDIAGKNFYRPISAKAQAKYAKQLPKLNLFTIEQAFGGWAKADKDHFADGGSFDQIYLKK